MENAAAPTLQAAEEETAPDSAQLEPDHADGCIPEANAGGAGPNPSAELEQLCGEGTGICLAGILYCIDLFISTSTITDSTTTSDLCHAHIKPATVPSGWRDEPRVVDVENRWYEHSYIEEATGRSHSSPPRGTRSMCSVLSDEQSTACFVGKPTHFLSHAWMYKIRNVVAALEQFVDSLPADAPEPFFWFDTFAIDEHASQDRPQEWWSTTFQQAIELMGHTVMMLSPWNAPQPLSRSWCLWELYCTYNARIPFSVCLGSDERREFMEAILQNSRVVFDVFAKISVEDAKAGSQSDEEMIKNTVKEHVGFSRLNSIAFEQMRVWIFNTLRQAVVDGEPEIRASERTQTEFATLVHQVASVFWQNGMHDEALPLYERALQRKEAFLQPDHPDIARTLNGLAAVQTDQGNPDEALRLYRRAFTIYEQALGSHHPDTTGTMSNIAIIHNESGNHDEALRLFGLALKNYKQALGCDHPDTATIMHNIAEVHATKGDCDEALNWYRKSLKSKEQALGHNHPSTAHTVHNMALIHDTNGDHDEALGLYGRALKIYEQVFGPDHPSTVATLTSMKVIHKDNGNHDEHLKLCGRDLKIKEEAVTPGIGVALKAADGTLRPPLLCDVAQENLLNVAGKHTVEEDLAEGSSMEEGGCDDLVDVEAALSSRIVAKHRCDLLELEEVAKKVDKQIGGNSSLLEALEGVLHRHLDDQLPNMLTQLSQRCSQLNADLSEPQYEPTWEDIEHLVLSYGRLVQAFAAGDRVPWDAMDSPKGLPQIKDELSNIISSLGSFSTVNYMYTCAFASDSILMESTNDILSEAQRKGFNGEDACSLGYDPIISPGPTAYPTHLIACRFADACVQHFDRYFFRLFTLEIKPALKHVLQRFYIGVAQVPIKCDQQVPSRPARAAAAAAASLLSGDRTIYRVDRFAKPCKIVGATLANGEPDLDDPDGNPMLWRRVEAATNQLCFSALEYIERVFAQPNARMQNRSNVVEFEELHTEITAFVHDLIKPVPQECAVSKTHSGSTVAAGAEDPPDGECQKQRHKTGTFRKVFMRLHQTDGLDPEHLVQSQNSLMIYKSRKDFEDGNAEMSSSIPNLTGYTVYAGPDETINLFQLHYTVKLFKANAKYEMQVFGWPGKEERDRFLAAMNNMSKGRPWNKTEAEFVAERSQQISEPELEPEPEPMPKPEPEPKTLIEVGTEVQALRTTLEQQFNAVQVSRLDAQIHGDAIFSPPFSSWIESVQAQPTNMELRSEERLADECLAEAYRTWSVKSVVGWMKERVERVEQKMEQQIQNLSGKHALFNGCDIFSAVGVSNMVTEYFEEEQKPGRRHKRMVGPSDLLRRKDDTQEVRKQKQDLSHSLTAILEKLSECELVSRRM